MPDSIPGMFDQSNSENETKIDARKEKILERLPLHEQKLLEIARVFNIAPELLTDEGDQKIANEVFRKKELIDNLKATGDIESRYSFYQEPKSFPGNGSSIDDMMSFHTHAYPLGYTQFQAPAIKKFGRVTDLAHNNLVVGIDTAKSLMFTPEEISAMSYFFGPQNNQSDVTSRDLKYVIEGQLLWLKINEMAQEDQAIKSFTEWADPKMIDMFNTLSRHGISNLISSYSKSADEETINDITSKFASLTQDQDEILSVRPSYFGPPELYKAEVLMARVFLHVADIYNQRLGYMIDRAKHNPDNFKLSPDDSSGFIEYEISPEFAFSQEDAVRAKELDLPWSQL